MEPRIDWSAETVDEGLDAFATALMLAGTGLPKQATVAQLRPYARAYADAEPAARTHVAWMIAGRVNTMRHYALAGSVLGVFALAVLLRWLTRVREPTPS